MTKLVPVQTGTQEAIFVNTKITRIKIALCCQKFLSSQLKLPVVVYYVCEEVKSTTSYISRILLFRYGQLLVYQITLILDNIYQYIYLPLFFIGTWWRNDDDHHKLIDCQQSDGATIFEFFEVTNILSNIFLCVLFFRLKTIRAATYITTTSFTSSLIHVLHDCLMLFPTQTVASEGCSSVETTFPTLTIYETETS